ncbi:MAG: indole-3-glycerol phosphate synthase TrpC [Pyrinomonadaceae bacterium]
MKPTYLTKIIALKRERISDLISRADIAEMKYRASAARRDVSPHRLRSALADHGKVNIIAEFKRASPSKGPINIDADIGDVIQKYDTGGACAVSVLTESDHFKGSLDDLLAARNATNLPLLRKDFIVDEVQIYESAVAGADAILLIAAVLTDDELGRFHYIAETVCKMDALVEIHSNEEMLRAAAIGARIIGVNNRDLNTFKVSLDSSRTLIAHKPAGTLMISESGLYDHTQLLGLHGLGYDGFLVGESLMRTDDPSAELRRMRTVSESA